MPFGTVDIQLADQPKPIKVDFNRVYRELLEPALRKAGCEPFRADSQISAGDIRTDMFFELVTADVVVADLSIPNPNVYYELGIPWRLRAGRFHHSGGWSASQPLMSLQIAPLSWLHALFSRRQGRHASRGTC